MTKRILFLGFIITISALAQAAPGVWEQMKRGHSPREGVVKSVEISGSDITATIETEGPLGQKQIENQRLCRSTDGFDDNRESEEIRAALLKSKIEVLEDARRTGKPIAFSSEGPWSPCVSFLRSSPR